jgi:hypothetical protein
MDLLSPDTLFLYAGIAALVLALRTGKQKHTIYQHKK